MENEKIVRTQARPSAEAIDEVTRANRIAAVMGDVASLAGHRVVVVGEAVQELPDPVILPTETE